MGTRFFFRGSFLFLFISCSRSLPFPSFSLSHILHYFLLFFPVFHFLILSLNFPLLSSFFPIHLCLSLLCPRFYLSLFFSLFSPISLFSLFSHFSLFSFFLLFPAFIFSNPQAAIFQSSPRGRCNIFIIHTWENHQVLKKSFPNRYPFCFSYRAFPTHNDNSSKANMGHSEGKHIFNNLYNKLQ